jgi:hypothetical protein
MTATKAICASVAVLVATSAARAQTVDGYPLRYGNTSGWSYDGRSDRRDFPTNSYFPGNFAADRWGALTGAAGLIGFNPQHSATPYASQVVFGLPCQPCRRHHRCDRPPRVLCVKTND